jgi:hypothetical protein
VRMARDAASASVLLESATDAAKSGDMTSSAALFEQAVLVAQSQNSLHVERQSLLGAAEMSWQVCTALLLTVCGPTSPRVPALWPACMRRVCLPVHCAPPLPSLDIDLS